MVRFFSPTLKIGAVLLAPLLSAPVFAQDEAEFKDKVLLELNSVQTNAEACTFTFQIINGHAEDIAKAVYETVLFDTEGTVDRLTLFDFGTLPAGRPRVRQFSIQGTRCEDLSRVLINGAHACESDGLGRDACESGLELNTRTSIEVAG